MTTVSPPRSQHPLFLFAFTLSLLFLGYFVYVLLLETHQPSDAPVRALPPAQNYPWYPSPHFGKRPSGITIDTIVLHATALAPLSKVIAYFQVPSSKVSAHFTIAKSGRVVQHVRLEDKAWHAGPSKLPDGRVSANDFSVGIELVNNNDGLDPYPEIQIASLQRLVLELSRNLPITEMYAHSEISDPPERKSDPRGFDMGEFRKWWKRERSSAPSN